MTTKQIFDLAVKMGTESDLRGPKGVQRYLERAQKKYDKLDEDGKKNFDSEKLVNPYSDSRILVDNKKNEIKKILVGVDIGVGELLLADKLQVGLVISHHPDGRAYADLHSVMDMQAEVLAGYGVPINIAESVLRPRISEVNRSTSPINHNRTVDVAKILKIDYICTHTVVDNLSARYLVDLIAEKKPEYVEDILKMLKEIPEYAEAAKMNAGPTLFAGNPDNSCGKVAITEFTGGTSGSKEIYEKMAQAGIGTIVGMHMGEEHRKEAEKYHINVVIAGHMASDSLGMNLFLDQVEKSGIEVIPCSGLIRIKR